MKLDIPEIHRSETPRQIVQPSRVTVPQKRRSLWWVWVLVVILLLGAGYWTYIHITQSSSATTARPDAAARGIPVVTAKSTTGDLPIYLDGLGTVTSLNTVTIRARVDGQIEKVAFTEGQLVKEGDLLVQIDPRPFEVQLTQAIGQQAKDQALYDVAKKNVERDKEAKDAIAAQQLDTDTSSMEQAQGALKVDEGQIASAKLQLTYCRITSPITGKIGLRLVDEGNIIHATDTNGLAVITQVQPISVIFNLSQTDIPQVLKRMHSGPPLQVDAYDADRTTKLATGQLLATDSQIDPTSGSLRFKATFPNKDDALFPNQFVNARLLVNTLQDVVLVPKEAVQLSPTSTYVYVVKAGEAAKTNDATTQDSAAKPSYTVEMRNIEVGPTEGDNTAITSGLSAGETVVTDGVDKLQDKSKVTLRQASTSQPIASTITGKKRNRKKPAAGDQTP